MLKRSIISALAVHAMVACAMLANCGSVAAGYMPPIPDSSIGSLLLSNCDALTQLAVNHPSIPELSSDQFPYSDESNKPIPIQQLLPTWLCILSDCRNASDPGGSNNGPHIGGFDRSSACLTLAPICLPKSDWDRVIDLDDFADRSVASRIFRPPRLF